jgi:hypothetical protein
MMRWRDASSLRHIVERHGDAVLHANVARTRQLHQIEQHSVEHHRSIRLDQRQVRDRLRRGAHGQHVGRREQRLHNAEHVGLHQLVLKLAIGDVGEAGDGGLQRLAVVEARHAQQPVEAASGAHRRHIVLLGEQVGDGDEHGARERQVVAVGDRHQLLEAALLDQLLARVVKQHDVANERGGGNRSLVVIALEQLERELETAVGDEATLRLVVLAREGDAENGDERPERGELHVGLLRLGELDQRAKASLLHADRVRVGEIERRDRRRGVRAHKLLLRLHQLDQRRQPGTRRQISAALRVICKLLRRRRRRRRGRSRSRRRSGFLRQCVFVVRSGGSAALKLEAALVERRSGHVVRVRLQQRTEVLRLEHNAATRRIVLGKADSARHDRFHACALGLFDCRFLVGVE